ncbi:MAG: ABC transporter permease [Chitinophagaceae bacterium]|jgi:Cu-processing system permease protein|nr:ABC transporter permease [Chitinophagaceae bacterium]
MNQILKYVVIDIVKNKVVLFYMLVLMLFSWSAFSLEDNSSKGVLTLLNIILLIVPMVSILFSTIYIYNSSEFIELLASHPIRRGKIWLSLFGGLSISLSIAFLTGVGIPLIIFAEFEKSFMMILVGLFITIIFVSIAFICSILSRDKAKGIGISIISWLFFALLFDGLVLFLLFQFSDYPIEKMMVVLTAFNPIDLSRILMLLQLDVSALMGYTGAIFQETFGTKFGMAVSVLILIFWIFAPFYLSLRLFKIRDL